MAYGRDSQICRDSSGVEHDHGKIGVLGSNPNRGSIIRLFGFCKKSHKKILDKAYAVCNTANVRLPKKQTYKRNTSSKN